MSKEKIIPFPTDEDIEKIRMQDAFRCKYYLTAEDFNRMYGNNKLRDENIENAIKSHLQKIGYANIRDFECVINVKFKTLTTVTPIKLKIIVS